MHTAGANSCSGVVPRLFSKTHIIQHLRQLLILPPLLLLRLLLLLLLLLLQGQYGLVLAVRVCRGDEGQVAREREKEQRRSVQKRRLRERSENMPTRSVLAHLCRSCHRQRSPACSRKSGQHC